MSLVDSDGEHLSHRVIHALGTTVGLRVVRAGGHFADVHEVVDGRRKLGAEVGAVVGTKRVVMQPHFVMYRLMRTSAVP